ncbi:MAG: SemiSWEET family transporter [Weeksellaceae bacterium]|nr:SemiSWEET family transporter [Weeksellaceae bacterium]
MQDPNFDYDWIGYAASVFVVGSFLITNREKTLRTVNLIGAVLFTIYGFLIENIPIIIPNVVLIFIQLYYLFKLSFPKRPTTNPPQN